MDPLAAHVPSGSRREPGAVQPSDRCVSCASESSRLSLQCILGGRGRYSWNQIAPSQVLTIRRHLIDFGSRRYETAAENQAMFPAAYAGTDAFWGWRVSSGAGVPVRPSPPSSRVSNGAAVPTPPSTPYGRTLQARVVRVVDGDTIEVQLSDGRREKVRYIGINTPEIHHPDQRGATRWG